MLCLSSFELYSRWVPLVNVIKNPFTPLILLLLESYMCDRNYRVKIGDPVSSSRTVNRGCPQGSALGHLLWNIFQNDLLYCVTTNLSMYADDHQIYHTGRDQSSVTLMLKESAQQATNWYNSNLLAGNLKKYQTLNIKRTWPKR